MKKAAVVIAVSLAVLATVSTIPTASADPRFHGRSAAGRFGGGHSFHSQGHSFHRHGHSFQKRGFGHHHHVFPRHFVSFGVVFAPPVVVYSPPPVFYAPPIYHSAPVSAPPVLYSPPPLPRVVEYPTGRYELRGDGVTTPYTWVWIPNPPPPPPAPPPAPPAEAPSSSDVPRGHNTVYRWADEHGVTHWTDRLDAVPARYRQQAKRFGPS